MVKEVFDFSTETGSYKPMDVEEAVHWDDESDLMHIESTTLDDIKISHPSDFGKGPEQYRTARKGKWEELTDTFYFYDIQTDPEGTWKAYKKIAQEFQKGDKRYTRCVGCSKRFGEKC